MTDIVHDGGGPPAFADSRLLRFGGFALLYSAQGLPWGIFMVAVPTWMAGSGFTSGEVGSFLAAVSFPWTLKLLTGPVMDRFSFLSMGRRRPWVMMAQAGILFGCLLLSLGIDDFWWILSIGFLINFCAAWQDVAVDGMAIDVLPVDERARANAFMFGGQAVGISGSSAGGAWLLSEYGIGAAGMGMAVCVAVIFIIPLVFRERRGERLLPWTAGAALPRSFALQERDVKRIFRDLVRVLILPMSLLLITVKFGDRIVVGVINATFPVLTTQELGFSDTFYPEWNAVAGICAAVFGVLIAPLVDRVGAQRALTAGLALKVAVIAGAGLMASLWTNPTVMIVVVFSVSFIGQLLTIATIALFMSLCAPKVAASQFAIYMALSNLALSAGSALIGPLDAALDFDQVFLAVAALDLVMLGMMSLFSLEKHMRRLETLFPADAAPSRS